MDGTPIDPHEPQILLTHEQHLRYLNLISLIRADIRTLAEDEDELTALLAQGAAQWRELTPVDPATLGLHMLTPTGATPVAPPPPVPDPRRVITFRPRRVPAEGS